MRIVLEPQIQIPDGGSASDRSALYEEDRSGDCECTARCKLVEGSSRRPGHERADIQSNSSSIHPGAFEDMGPVVWKEPAAVLCLIRREEVEITAWIAKS